MEGITARPESSHSDDAARLLAGAVAELNRRYPEFGATPYDPTEADQPGAAFVIARKADGEAVGCGALRPFREGVAEIKRMFVPEQYRRRGVSREIMVGLESAAEAAGYDWVVLETGVRQPEAIARYEKVGYDRIPNYGRYEGDDLSVCFAKKIKKDTRRELIL